MALTPGTRLGAYEVVSLLGEGGMGQVYRAHDTKLNRDVALKILRNAFAADGDRLGRFRREAQVLASLNHPNIAHIYGFEDSGNTHALVLELVDGPTLADRVAKGPISLAEALPIAKQITDALEAAHEQGIIHRDLKPANIKVRDDGTVKVLDFGLAKALDSAGASSLSATMSPTISLHATQAGIILGTAAYMSPEQTAGKPLDKRSDIWAFGVVLWEMLTGTNPFGGETISHTLAFVMTKEPDWNELPADSPAPIRRLLRRALEKDRKRRLPDAGSARLEIDDALATPTAKTSAASSPGAVATSRAAWRVALPWALAAVFGTGFAVALAMWEPWRRAEAGVAVRLTADVGADTSLGVSGASVGALALSPDGKLLAFSAQTSTDTSQLYIRRLDQLRATALAGTEDARSPFFSPDGQWIGFFAGTNLKKVSITGGAAITICAAGAGRGATWGDDARSCLRPRARQVRS